MGKKKDPDAIIKSFVKVEAKQEAVGNVPGYIDVVRYPIQTPYLHVITQVLSLFFLGTEVGSLSSRQVVAKSARPVAHLDHWQRVRNSPFVRGRNDGIIGVVWYVGVVVDRLVGDEIVVVGVDALRLTISGRTEVATNTSSMRNPDRILLG